MAPKTTKKDRLELMALEHNIFGKARTIALYLGKLENEVVFKYQRNPWLDGPHGCPQPSVLVSEYLFSKNLRSEQKNKHPLDISCKISKERSSKPAQFDADISYLGKKVYEYKSEIGIKKFIPGDWMAHLDSFYALAKEKMK